MKTFALPSLEAYHDLPSPPLDWSNLDCVSVWLIEVAQPRVVYWLRSIANNGQLGWLANLGQVHPGGFIKYDLHRWSTGERLRLHFWGEPGAELDIHDHRWSYVSLPLAGRFIEDRYKLVQGVFSEYNSLVCRPRDAFGNIIVGPGLALAAVPAERLHYKVGEAYGLRSGDFHVFRRAANELSVTLVLTSRTTREHANILTRREIQSQITTPQPTAAEAAKS